MVLLLPHFLNGPIVATLFSTSRVLSMGRVQIALLGTEGEQDEAVRAVGRFLSHQTGNARIVLYFLFYERCDGSGRYRHQCCV